VAGAVVATGTCEHGTPAYLANLTTIAVPPTGRAGCSESFRVQGLVDLAGNALAEPRTLGFVRPAWLELPGMSAGTANGSGFYASNWLSAALDSAGHPVVAWSEYYDGTFPTIVRVKRWTGTSWQELPRLDQAFHFGHLIHDAVARHMSGPNVYVAVGASPPNEGRLGVHAFRWDGSAWAHIGGPLNVDPARTITELEATEDADGGLWLAWTEVNTSPSSLAVASFVQRWDGTSWEPVREIHRTDATSSASSPRVAAGEDGTVAVAWYQWVGPAGPAHHPQVFVEVWRGSVWTALPSPAEGVHADCPEVEVDPLGTVFASWVEGPLGQQALRAAFWSGTAWVPMGDRLNFDPARFVRCPRLAVEGPGRVVLSRTEEDTSEVPQLWISRWDGSAWSDLPGPLEAPAGVPVWWYQVAAAPGAPTAVAYQLGQVRAPQVVRVENR
jgi:hypothetical protein